MNTQLKVDKLRNSLANLLEVVREIPPETWRHAEQLAGIYQSIQVAMDAIDFSNDVVWACFLCKAKLRTLAGERAHFDAVHLPLIREAE